MMNEKKPAYVKQGPDGKPSDPRYVAMFEELDKYPHTDLGRVRRAIAEGANIDILLPVSLTKLVVVIEDKQAGIDHELVKMYLELGASPNAWNGPLTAGARRKVETAMGYTMPHTLGFTTFSQAIRYTGRPDIVKLMLEYGAEVNKKDSYGETAVLAATYAMPKRACWKHLKGVTLSPEQDVSPEKCIELLLKAGANPYEKALSGESALSRAQNVPIAAEYIVAFRNAGLNV